MKKYHLSSWELALLRVLRWLYRVPSTSLEWPALLRQRMQALQSIPLWIGAVLTGLMAVGYEKLFSWVEARNLAWLHAYPYWFFLTTPLLFVLSWGLVYYLAPAARGSGIPQLMAGLEVAEHPAAVRRLLSLRIACIKVLSSLVLLLGGGAIGREGPTLQIAGSLFGFIHRKLPRFWPPISQRIMLLTGGASGLAAAFNTPLGGIVFVVEELTRTHLAQFRTNVLVAVIIAGMTAQFLLGPYLYLGFPPIYLPSRSTFWVLPLAGVLSGFGGAGMAVLLLKINKIKERFRHPWHHLVFALGMGILFCGIVYVCGADSTGSGKELINRQLFRPQEPAGWEAFPGRLLGSVVSYSSGGAGGVFAPSLSAGAALGGLLTRVLPVDPALQTLIVLVSMVGFLTGVTRSPFTSAILVLEMTDRHSAIFYFLMAGVLANWAGKMLDTTSFYERLKEKFLAEVRPYLRAPGAA
jgi:H+/Cl- antiporter ClcA